MNKYSFVGPVFYHAATAPHDLVKLVTKITVDAPTKKIALAIFSNYGIGAASSKTVQTETE